MKTRWTFLALAFFAVIGVDRAAGRQDTPAQNEITLTCKPPPPKEKAPLLVLSGSANLPEGTVLNLTVFRQFEAVLGSKIVLSPEQLSSFLTEVKSKRFQQSPQVPGPGLYSVEVHLSDDFQKPTVAQALKGKVSMRKKLFPFAAWADDLVGQLGPKLLELEAIIRECLAMVDRVEKQASSESDWVKDKKEVKVNGETRDAELTLTKEADEIVKETGKLLARLERSDVRPYFPAAHQEVFFSMRSMHGNAQHFAYEKGKFAGAKSYHSGGDGIKTHRNEPFSFENMKRYLTEAIQVSGREYALWIVKDLRRTNGQMRPDILESLKMYGKRPGVDFIADRLAQATVADLNAFEEEIRGSLNDKKDEKKEGAEKEKPVGDWECPVCKKKNKGTDATCTATAKCKGTRP